ncbi:phage portal protein [Streptosporangium sp. NPDC051022]|uniref:phage portal protein n=1 Tax=Streptosporangium sp. NPDC051022 TaxID=3155752 RepID=UPI00343053CC
MTLRFLPSLRTSNPAPAQETKSWDLSRWPLTSRFRGTRPAMTIERVVAEGYERVIWVFRAVDTIASAQAKLPFRFEQLLDDGTRKPILDDPLVRLLNSPKKKVNALETGRQFRHRLSGQILLSPMGAFVEVEQSNAGEPIGLHLLPPGRTRPVAGSGKLLSHYETIDAGGIRHEVSPERVRWFRKPHPTDPFRAITPMEAAGLAVDLEFLALLYNVTFLRNDARPGGVIGIKGDEVAPGEMERIQKMFHAGAHHAGKISVLGGELSFIDLAARPRDLAYGELSKLTKEMILTAFGTPESLLGNAGGKTFANASEEEDNFWLITMDDHLSIVATGWDQDSDDDVEAGFDLSGVPAFQRLEAARRAEAREDVAAGLRTIDEYRQVAGLEPFDMPHTRALYVPQGKTPIPTTEEDAVALGIAPPEESGTTVDVEQIPNEEPGAGQAALPPGSSSQSEAEGASGPDRGAAAAITRLQNLLDGEGEDGEDDGAVASEAAGGRQTKALPASTEAPALHAVAQVRDQLDTDLQAALGGLVDRLAKRTAARVLSPKNRKGTRHFVPEYEVDTRVGTAPLDVGKLVPVDYQVEAEQTLRPLVAAAADRVAELGGIKSGQQGAVTADVVEETTLWLASQVGATAVDVRTLVGQLDARGETAEEIAASVRDTVADWSWWLPGGAARAASALVGAAGYKAAAHLAGGEDRVVSMWRARHAEHEVVDGQAQVGGEPFLVHDMVLRHPGDLTGSVWETTGCTCYTVHILPEPLT